MALSQYGFYRGMNMKKELFSLIILSIYISGCCLSNKDGVNENSIRCKSSEELMSPNIIKSDAADCYLSELQRKKSIIQALQGSSDAAFTIYKYYSFLRGDALCGRKWLLLTAELGNQVAIHNLKSLAEMGTKVTPQNAFNLTLAEKNQQENQALSGSGEAAYWTYLYYRFCTKNLQEAEKWRWLAVKLHVKIAEQSLFEKYDHPSNIK